MPRRMRPAPDPAGAGPDSPLQLSLPMFGEPAAVAREAATVPGPPPTSLPRASEPPSAPTATRTETPSPNPHRLFHHPRGSHEIRFDEHRVSYELRRARRRSIGFVIGEEGLTVSAPRWVAQAEIEVALQSKARWILRKLMDQGERLGRLAAARVDWRDGTELPYLGEPLIVLLDARVDGAVLNASADALPGIARRTLHVGLPHTAEPAQIRDAVQSWLQRQALQLFEQRCQVYAQRLGVRVRRLTLSSANTRWGSAKADGTIRLHWRLMHFALPTIDYVVAHELAHLREMNHSAAFWDVVRSVVPHFEQARGALRTQTLPVFD